MSVPDPSLSGMTSFPNLARMASRGNRLATVVSAFAFAFSGVSFYETVMKQPQLAVYVPPVLHYGQDGGGDTELFAIPITISNDGARTGTVLSMELTAENVKTKVVKTFYAAYFGEHSKSDVMPRAFAPLSIQGRSTFSDTIRFYPAGNPKPAVLEAPGEVKFTLALQTVKPAPSDPLSWFWHAAPKPVVFARTLPWYDWRTLRAKIAVAMKDASLTPPPEPEPAAAAAAPVQTAPAESAPKP